MATPTVLVLDACTGGVVAGGAQPLPADAQSSVLALLAHDAAQHELRVNVLTERSGAQQVLAALVHGPRAVVVVAPITCVSLALATARRHPPTRCAPPSATGRLSPTCTSCCVLCCR